ncbi:MAG: ribose-phosphate pyrophosphokinae [Rickettsiaceae bacterium]|jgi:ribose-phosphate pyrophosphokinase|nr:ribose-phosphate pyrophosphokinae [Rickettsiaceae bacterium]
MDKILVSCPQSVDLARTVAEKAHLPFISLVCKTYSCNEYLLKLTVDADLKDKKVILFQGLNKSVNDAIFELFHALDIVSRLKPAKIDLVLPYLFYSRQDKEQPHCSHGLKLFLKLLKSFGVNNLTTVDMHSEIDKWGLGIEIVTISPTPLWAEHIRARYANNIVIVTPDNGSLKRARSLAEALEKPLIELKKTRMNGIVTYPEFLCELDPKNFYILVDDIIDTGATLCQAAEILYKAGARDIIAYCTHGILADDAYKRIEDSRIRELYISNSVERLQANKSSKIKITNIEKLLVQQVIAE